MPLSISCSENDRQEFVCDSCPFFCCNGDVQDCSDKAEKGIQLLHYLQQLVCEPLQNLQRFSMGNNARAEERN